MITATHTPRFVRVSAQSPNSTRPRRECVFAVKSIRDITDTAAGYIVTLQGGDEVVLLPEEYDRLMAALNTGGDVLDLMEGS
jgi:hypothetical protein